MPSAEGHRVFPGCGALRAKLETGNTPYYPPRPPPPTYCSVLSSGSLPEPSEWSLGKENMRLEPSRKMKTRVKSDSTALFPPNCSYKRIVEKNLINAEVSYYRPHSKQWGTSTASQSLD